MVFQAVICKFFLHNHGTPKYPGELGEKMFRQNRKIIGGFFATLGIMGSASVSLASTTCTTPDPLATNWACVDVYLTPSPSELFTNISGLQFQINNAPLATIYSATNINEAAAMELFATLPDPVIVTDYERIIGGTTTPFSSGTNPLFNLKYGFSAGVFPAFTIDTATYPPIFDPMTVTAGNILLKTEYVLNSGAVSIVNGFPLDLTVGGSGTGTVTSTPTGISCNSGTCRYPFTIATPVTLTAATGKESCFSGWSCPGGTISSNVCSFSSYNPANTSGATALFNLMAAAIAGQLMTQHCTLQEAVNIAANGSSILARADILLENLVMNRNNTTLTLKGGYTDFALASTGITTLSGSLTLQQGSLIVEKLAVF